MSYHKKETITINYIDHEARLEGSGNSYRAVAVPVKRKKDVDIIINVDTTPFDDSVNNSISNISELTGSIVGFEAANVASKKVNEQMIVGHVASGFLNMIEQNINLQNAGMQADMTALAGELMQQCKELGHKHDVMSKDYERIKERYSNLFDTINKELGNRLKALMKPCFDFVKYVKKEQERRSATNLLSMATVGGKETDSARTAILSSRLKNSAATLISTSREYIKKGMDLSATLDAFSIHDSKSELFFTPVLAMSEKSSSANSSTTRIWSTPLIGNNGVAEDYLKQQISALGETPIPSESLNRINDYFYQMLNNMDDGSDATRRVVETMKKLYTKSQMMSYA